MDVREKLKEILNEYYGDSRDDNHKEEIIDFLEASIWTISDVFEDAGII